MRTRRAGYIERLMIKTYDVNGVHVRATGVRDAVTAYARATGDKALFIDVSGQRVGAVIESRGIDINAVECRCSAGSCDEPIVIGPEDVLDDGWMCSCCQRASCNDCWDWSDACPVCGEPLCAIDELFESIV